jgi:hypothetical protein
VKAAKKSDVEENVEELFSGGAQVGKANEPAAPQKKRRDRLIRYSDVRRLRQMTARPPRCHSATL